MMIQEKKLAWIASINKLIELGASVAVEMDSENPFPDDLTEAVPVKRAHVYRDGTRDGYLLYLRTVESKPYFFEEPLLLEIEFGRE